MRYAVILPTFWTRGSGRRLRGKKAAQVLALYLMTCPARNLIGVYYLAKVTICHETGLTGDEFDGALTHLDGIAHYDPETELVWVPSLARYQIGTTLAANDKRRKSIMGELAMVGTHSFASAFVQRYRKPYRLEGVVVEAPSKGLVRGFEGCAATKEAPCTATATDLVVSGGSGGSDAERPMTTAWRPRGESLDSLTIGGIPKWAHAPLLARFVGHFVNKQDDCRGEDGWNQGFVRWAHRDWAEPRQRPQKPAEGERTLEQRAATIREREASEARELARIDADLGRLAKEQANEDEPKRGRRLDPGEILK